MNNITDLQKFREKKQKEIMENKRPWLARIFGADPDLEQKREEDKKKDDDYNPWEDA